MHKTTFNLPEDIYRKANVAAASQGLSTSELCRGAVIAALVTIAQRDGAVAAAFNYMDSEDSQIAAGRSGRAVKETRVTA